MEKARIDDLSQRVRRLRAEAEALGHVAHDFPALRKNSDRLLACVRMMEMDLGFVPPSGVGGAPEACGS